MKKAFTLAVGAVLAIAASSQAASAFYICHGASLKADEMTLAPDLIPSNVPTCDGDFVSGFQIVGGGGIEWYADAHHQDRCFDVQVTFLPEGVSAFDMDAVLDFLGDRDLDVFRLVKGNWCPV